MKRDSNPRPSGPKPDALPSCAIHRVLYSLLVKQTEGHPRVHLFLKAGDALPSCAIHRILYSLLVKQTEAHPLVRLFPKAGDALLSYAIHRCKFLVSSLLVPRGASFNLPNN